MTEEIKAPKIKPCISCGSLNDVRRSYCRPCDLKRHADYRAKNKEKLKAYGKVYAERVKASREQMKVMRAIELLQDTYPDLNVWGFFAGKKVIGAGERNMEWIRS